VDGADDTASCEVALLGAAHIHLKDLARVVRSYPGVRVASVWDHEPDRAKRWAARLDARPCLDLDAALAGRALRGALVYSETSRHVPLVAAAARRDLATFVEKPLAAGRAEVVAVSEAVARTRRPFSTGFFLRYADAFVRLRDMVRTDELGQVLGAAISVTHGGAREGWFGGEHAWMREPAEGGGGFFDLVVHGIDLVGWVLGAIAHVGAVRVGTTGHHGSAVVRTAAGARVDLEAGWEAPAPVIRMTVTGSAGTLTATAGTLTAGTRVIATGRQPDAGDAPRAWLDALTGHPAPPLVSLSDAVDCANTVGLLRHRASTGPR
jgi:predicted dehydrogenase